MKTTIFKISIIFLLFGLMGAGCEKEEPPCACGIENPLENLDWLKQILDSEPKTFKVYSFTSGGNEYIVIDSFVGNALMQFYSCDGELQCEVGGAAGAGGDCDMPAEYWSDFEKNKKLIFPLE